MVVRRGLEAAKTAFHEILLTRLIILVHADELRQVYTYLSEKLEAQTVARYMYECNALTLRELQSIQSERSEPVKAAEQLVNIVINQSSNVYSFFVDALEKTGQQHVSEVIITGNRKGMYVICDILSPAVSIWKVT